MLLDVTTACKTKEIELLLLVDKQLITKNKLGALLLITGAIQIN